MRRFVYLFFLFPVLDCFSQDTADSLRSVLSSKSTIDNEYVDTINELAINLILGDPVEGIEMANEALRVAETIDYPNGKFIALVNKGSALWTTGLYDQALVYYYKARSINEFIPVSDRIALCNNIGEVFKQKSLFDSSLAYYNQGLVLSKTDDSNIDFSLLIYNIGELYLMQSEMDSAEFYFTKAFEKSNANGTVRYQAYSLFGLGEIDFKKKEFGQAIKNHKDALALRLQINDQRGLIQSHLSLGRIYLEVGSFDSAMHYFVKSLELSKSAQSPELRIEAYHELAVVHEKAGALASAIHFLHLHHELRDSLNKVSFIASTEQIKRVLTAELVEVENRALKDEKEIEKAKNRSRIMFIIFTASSFLLIGIAYYQFKTRAISSSHSKKLEERNKQLTDCAFMVSHNLREPVSQILGFVDLNKNTDDLPQKETWEHLEKTANEIDQAVRLLSDQLEKNIKSGEKG